MTLTPAAFRSMLPHKPSRKTRQMIDEERERCAKIAEDRALIWRKSVEAPNAVKATEAEAIAHEIRSTN